MAYVCTSYIILFHLGYAIDTRILIFTRDFYIYFNKLLRKSGVRPFGVSLLLAGWDEDEERPYLYQCDPSGAYFAWKATAMGKNFVNGKTFLEKRYSDNLELEDAIHTAILTLKESFEGQMTEDNIEIGICNKDGFRRLNPPEVKDYLASVQ